MDNERREQLEKLVELEDKRYELIMDAIEDGVSNCCGAPVVGDVCTACQEHCDIEPLEE